MTVPARNVIFAGAALLALVGLALLTNTPQSPEEAAHARAVSLCAQIATPDVRRCVHVAEMLMEDDDR